MSTQPAPPRPSNDHRRTSGAPKRQSILPKPSSIFLDTTVLIAQHAQITGTHPVTIGPNTVLHPHSKLSSAVAPVVLGEGCVVFERAKVGVGMGAEGDAEGKRGSMAPPARGSGSVRESMRSEGTVLGRNVVVDSGAVVEAAEVGEGSVVEVGAVLGRGSIIGRRVDRTLQLRPELLEQKMAVHAKQLDMFKKLIPNNIAKWS
ncbi:hypothetical protein J4E85_000911 [Alternaria conjuncta]|uniref:uncharacterized protein n=1 Tax=Alternaria conjuncta TaxID=181017 RepID=UPI00221F84B5|nr:uncharacterized protein J4E85_000911 [Alternaria conjuncta]KAI4938471.1 hypothetical protein J4E85_000911 [Alternaria conjuncta]